MFKNSKFQLTLLIFIICASFLSYMTVLGADPDCTGKTLKECQELILNQIGNQSGYGSTQSADAAEGALATRIGEVVGMILGVLGVVFLFLVVYSGIQWMTAGGNEEKVTKARQRITRAAIGLIIVTAAYALSAFVLSKIQQPANFVNNCGNWDNMRECNDHQCEWNTENEVCYRSCNQYDINECAIQGCNWDPDFEICSN